jgi:hypothetical protein
MTLTRTALEGLARRVAEAGLTAANPSDLNLLAQTAEVVGISPVLVEVLVNPAEPIVVRERAFSLITCGVSGPLRSGHALAA